MLGSGEWGRRARGALVHETGDIVPPDATGMLMDVTADVIARHLELRIEFHVVRFVEAAKKLAALLAMPSDQAVATGILEALHVPLEPAEVLIQRAVTQKRFDVVDRFGPSLRGRRSLLVFGAKRREKLGVPEHLHRRDEALAGREAPRGKRGGGYLQVGCRRVHDVIPFDACTPSTDDIRFVTNASRSAAAAAASVAAGSASSSAASRTPRVASSRSSANWRSRIT